MNRSSVSAENLAMEGGESSGATDASNGPYSSVHNPASSRQHQQHDDDDELAVLPSTSTRDYSRLWVKVLMILVVALIIDVIILTVHVVQDEDSSSSSWYPLPPSDQQITKVVFGSCASQDMPQPYWDTVAAYQPDVMILAGDNVYGDCESMECAELKQAYEDFAAHPSWVGAKKTLPIIATLDDHDYGINDATGLNPYKHIAKEAFLDFFDIHDERRARLDDGVYKSYEWGASSTTDRRRVQVILLDTRFHRSPFLDSDEPGKPGKERYMPDYANTTKRMLSDQQWTWLEEELAKPNFPVRLIVSSIQVIQDGSGFDSWRHLPHERDRFVELVQQTQQRENDPSLVLILSGDRHVGAFYEYEGVYEITASSWTHSLWYGVYGEDCTDAASCDEVDDRRVDDFVRWNNFGSVEVDWAAQKVRAALRRAESSDFYEHHMTNKTSDAGQVLQEQQYDIP